MPELPTWEVERRFRQGTANGLNRLANMIAADAIAEAPLGPALDVDGEAGFAGELRASALYPLVDELSAADTYNLSAEISFNTVYAAAQHEGIAEMTRNGTTYIWEVRNYTTPGTKKKYLEDPLKVQTGGGQMERILAESIEKEMRRG